MDIRLPIGVVYIICRTTELGVRPEVQMRYLTMHIHHYEISSKDILDFEARVPILKGMAPYSLQTQILIGVSTVTFHNYKK